MLLLHENYNPYVMEEGTGLNRRWPKGRILRWITYRRKGPGWTGGDQMGEYYVDYRKGGRDRV